MFGHSREFEAVFSFVPALHERTTLHSMGSMTLASRRVRPILSTCRARWLVLTVLLAAPGLAAIPPDFERRDGAAVDGQTVPHRAGPRRQIVSILPDRTTGRDWGMRYLAEAVDDLNRIRPDAVFAVGDLVQGYSRDPAELGRWHADYLATVGQLEMPFYPTPGNHDLVGGLRDPSDRSLVDEYRRRFGPLHYAVELELASFVILNTEDGEGAVQPGFSEAQLRWLDETLRRLATRSRPILILMHRPLWDHRPTRWDERVQPMLVRHGVDAVIAGHYHTLQMLPPRGGIPFLIVGTCGGAVDQHPLTGQLQHLTHLVIDDTGRIDTYHQVAGTTLPADWILQADQALAYDLKSGRDVVAIRGGVAEPLGTASTGAVEVVVRNPLDRPISVRFEQTGLPVPWRVVDRNDDGPTERVWTSRTPIDVFNPATTDLASPFTLELPSGSRTIAPGGSETFRIEAACPAVAVPPLPPPFDVIAEFIDSKGRAVPVMLRQRLPIARRVRVAESLDAAIEYPIAVWRWSPYDTSEANPTLRVAATDDGPLEIALRLPDQVLSDDARPADRRGGPADPVSDPLGDAVRIVLGENAEAREYLVHFRDDAPRVRTLGPDGRTLLATEDATATLLAGDGDSRLLLVRLRASALPEGARIHDLPVNVGVADNDETFHTQWRWLAPQEAPARLVR